MNKPIDYARDRIRGCIFEEPIYDTAEQAQQAADARMKSSTESAHGTPDFTTQFLYYWVVYVSQEGKFGWHAMNTDYYAIHVVGYPFNEAVAVGRQRMKNEPPYSCYLEWESTSLRKNLKSKGTDPEIIDLLDI